MDYCIVKEFLGERRVYTRGFTWSRYLRQAMTFPSQFEARNFCRRWDIRPIDVAELPAGFRKAKPLLTVSDLELPIANDQTLKS